MEGFGCFGWKPLKTKLNFKNKLWYWPKYKDCSAWLVISLNPKLQYEEQQRYSKKASFDWKGREAGVKPLGFCSHPSLKSLFPCRKTRVFSLSTFCHLKHTIYRTKVLKQNSYSRKKKFFTALINTSVEALVKTFDVNEFSEQWKWSIDVFRTPLPLASTSSSQLHPERQKVEEKHKRLEDSSVYREVIKWYRLRTNVSFHRLSFRGESFLAASFLLHSSCLSPDTVINLLSQARNTKRPTQRLSPLHHRSHLRSPQ